MSQDETAKPRLLLDQGVPVGAAALFRERNYVSWHVAELGLQQAEDETILLEAEKRDSVVITLDADFHAIVATRGLSRPSVIRIRQEGCRAHAVVDLLLGASSFDMPKNSPTGCSFQ